MFAHYSPRLLRPSMTTSTVMQGSCDPLPMKWSTWRYGFLPGEDRNSMTLMMIQSRFRRCVHRLTGPLSVGVSTQHD
jgi:hypothetical protein